MTYQQSFTIQASGFAKDEQFQLKNNLVSYTDTIPTGIFVKQGDRLEIDVSGQLVNARIGLTKEFVGYESAGLKITKLANGKNMFVAQTDGVLYLENNSLSQSANVTITAPQSVEQTILINKTHTANDVINMLAANPTAKAVEIQGDHVLITVTHAAAKAYLTDPQALIKQWEQISDYEDDLAGLSKTGTGVNQISKDYIHIVQVSDKHFMYATSGHTGFNTTHGAPIILSAEQLVKNGWGPWHELGHQHQIAGMQWEGMGEVTENIFSLFVNDQLTASGAPNRFLESEIAPVDQFLAANPSMVGKTHVEFGNFGMLSVFAQMYLAFGKTFYQNLHQYYRLLADENLPKTSDGLINHFVVAASKVSGYDLRPLFESWKFTNDQASKDQIGALGLKTLPLDLANYPTHNAEGNYNAKLNLYTGTYIVPEATPNHGLVYQAGSTAVLDDLIAYDKTTIKSATFLKPLDLSEAGIKNAFVLIEDNQGHQNIIPIQVLVVPKTYANTSDQEIVNQANHLLSTLVDLEVPTSLAPIKQVEWLQFVDSVDAGELMNYYSKYIVQANDRAISYLEALNTEDITQAGDDYIKLKISNDQLSHLKTFGKLQIRMYADDKYMSTFDVSSSGTVQYYSGRWRTDGEFSYFYSLELTNSSTFSNVRYEFDYVTNTQDQFATTFTSNRADFGTNTAYNMTMIEDHVFATQIDGFAGLALDKKIYQEIESDGDLAIKMYLNGVYQGEVSEKLGVETPSVGSYFSESASASLFSMISRAILPDDYIRFDLSYQQNGSTNVQQKTLNYFGSELGFVDELAEPQSVLTLTDVMGRLKINPFINPEKNAYAGVSLAQDFYQQLEAQGDLDIKMYVNGKLTGEVLEEKTIESLSYFGRYAIKDNQSYFYTAQDDLLASDQLSFEITYRQHGSSVRATEILTVTGVQAGIQANDVDGLKDEIHLTDIMAQLKSSQFSQPGQMGQIEGPFAAISFDQDYYQRMENGGDTTIKMYLNEQYLGAVSEFQGAERPDGAGRFVESGGLSYFYLNQTGIKATDQIRFEVNYRSGPQVSAQDVLSLTGAELGFGSNSTTPIPATPTIDIDDVISHSTKTLVEGQFAGISFPRGFYNDMEQSGDLTINMYVNNVAVGLVNEINTVEAQHMQGLFKQDGSNCYFYVNNSGLLNTDLVTFDISYRPTGAAANGAQTQTILFPFSEVKSPHLLDSVPVEQVTLVLENPTLLIPKEDTPLIDTGLQNSGLTDTDLNGSNSPVVIYPATVTAIIVDTAFETLNVTEAQAFQTTQTFQAL